MKIHDLRVTGHQAVGRLHELRFDCPVCDLAGSLILPSREVAEDLFRSVRAAHFQLERT